MFTTREELFKDFIASAVEKNAKFPPEKVGRASLSIQELLHDKSIEELSAYIDFLEKNFTQSRAQMIKSAGGEIRIAGFAKSTVIRNLDEILKKKLNSRDLEAKKQALKEIDEQLEELTPKEIKFEKLTQKRQELLQGLQ